MSNSSFFLAAHWQQQVRDSCIYSATIWILIMPALLQYFPIRFFISPSVITSGSCTKANEKCMLVSVTRLTLNISTDNEYIHRPWIYPPTMNISTDPEYIYRPWIYPPTMNISTDPEYIHRQWIYLPTLNISTDNEYIYRPWIYLPTLNISTDNE
jgi:hypothetical protein